MPQLDSATFLPQLFWLVVTFGILFLVMWRIALPRVADVLEARQERMSSNLEKAEDFKKEAEAVLEAYEAAMAEARSKALDVIAEVRGTMAEEAASRQADLAEKLTEQIEQGEARIEQAKNEAIGQIQGVSAELTAAAMERLTGEKPNDAAVSAAVEAAFKARAN
ncbi:MAG: F0F1 ATP synthase subunit B family protein [Rhodospirillales bacterium]|jgi:F-type H+-transporting ATPase subunit b